MINVAGKMPLLFIGHGSPMNAIEDNDFTRGWQQIAGRIPKPNAILVVSAHWYTDGSRVTDAEQPKMVYDMYGFPQQLYNLEYKAKGAPELAHLTKELVGNEIKIDNTWGYDHGAWSILQKMYPEADIPVYQLSVDRNASPMEHFNIGQKISVLREKGVLILASGNVVHNLSNISWGMQGGYPWAIEFNNYVKDKVTKGKYQDLVNYHIVENAAAAIPTPDHFYPLLYILGASRLDDKVTIFNDSCVMGSLSMTCYLFE